MANKSDYDKTRLIVLKEINAALGAVDGKKVEEMIEMICLAEKVFVIGVGRVLLMLQAFVKRLPF